MEFNEPAQPPRARPLPNRQHICDLVAIENVVPQFTGSVAHPASGSMGTHLPHPYIGVTHAGLREYRGRRGVETLGERHFRPTFSRIDTRMAASSSSVEHHGSRTRLAQLLREHSVADSSLKAYKRAFAYWKRWARARGVPWQLKAPLDVQIRILSEFIIDGARAGFGSNCPVRASTIKSMLCGIAHFFTAAGLHFPSSHPQVRMLLKGLGRLDSPSRQKAPVSISLLERCFNALDLNSPAHQALWGVLCLAFFFLLRRSEIVAISSTSLCWFVLKAADITTPDAAGSPTTDPNVAQNVCIRLTGSKTNQGGSPTTRMLTRSGHPALCPVLGALILLKARGRLPATIPVAVYSGSNGVPSCVTAAHVASAIRQAARDSGEDPEQFGTHSLRAGGATNMYRSGVDALTIQFHGRWASDTFKLYTRLCGESVALVAAKMISGEGETSTL